MFTMACPYCKMELAMQDSDEERNATCPFCDETITVLQDAPEIEETKAYACPNCHTRFSCLTGPFLRIVFGFKCGNCKAKYIVSMPKYKKILLQEIILIIVLLATYSIGVKLCGYLFLLIGIFVLVLIGHSRDRWLKKYISNNGTFTRIDIKE